MKPYNESKIDDKFLEEIVTFNNSYIKALNYIESEFWRYFKEQVTDINNDTNLMRELGVCLVSYDEFISSTFFNHDALMTDLYEFIDVMDATAIKERIQLC